MWLVQKTPQSDSKLKPIATSWSPSFSCASCILLVFTSGSHCIVPLDIFFSYASLAAEIALILISRRSIESALMWHTIRTTFAYRTHLQRLIVVEPKTCVTYDPNVSQDLIRPMIFFSKLEDTTSDLSSEGVGFKFSLGSQISLFSYVNLKSFFLDGFCTLEPVHKIIFFFTNLSHR